QIADAPHKGHADGVGEQIARHDPGRIVDHALYGQFELDDNLWQKGRDNRQIKRADKDRDADQRQNEPGASHEAAVAFGVAAEGAASAVAVTSGVAVSVIGTSRLPDGAVACEVAAAVASAVAPVVASAVDATASGVSICDAPLMS